MLGRECIISCSSRKGKGKFMKLKMKKIVATVTALALSLTGAITLGITSNAQTYQYQEGTETKKYEIVDSIDINFAELKAGDELRVYRNSFSGDTDFTSKYALWMYNSLDGAINEDVNDKVDEGDIFNRTTAVEGKDYYIRVNCFAVDNRTAGTRIHGTTSFGENTTQLNFSQNAVWSKASFVDPVQRLKDAGINEKISGTYDFIFKVTAQPNPNAVAPAQETPTVDTPAVESAPVEAVAESTPEATEETPAPAEAVKAENTVPKTGDALPIVPFVLMGLGVIAGSVVVLQKRYF